MIQIEWKDAPSSYAQECLNKKDNFDLDDFLQDYKVVKIDRAPVAHSCSSRLKDGAPPS